MKPYLSLLLLLASPLLAADAAFDRFADRLADEWMRADPEAATQQQYFSGAEQDALDRQLTPIAKSYRAARVAAARRALEQLAKFDSARLDQRERISAASLRFLLNEVIAAEPFAEYYSIFQQFHGLQVSLVNFLTQIHPIRHRRDVESYLARLELVAGQMREGIAQTRDRDARGIPLPPNFILQSTIAQFDRFLAGPPATNVLVTALAERSAKLTDLSAAERAAFVAAAEKVVTADIMPAFREAQALLRDELPRSTADAGVWRFPNGDKLYAQALHRLTTTDYTARQIHDIGRREVARIEKEMDGLLRQLHYADGTVKERMEQLQRSLQPPAEPDPRPALLAKYETILRDANERAVLLFDIRPKAPCVVKREPSFTEKTAAAHYSSPARDGTRPGIFWVPLPGPFEMAQMRTLTYHEAIPGHHFQLALQQENASLPRFRRDRVFGFISAFGEGWALYAEHLAAENGWYEGDPVGRLGQLQDELFRARRLVVDTGIHAMKWTRQQAIDFGIKASEVERYVVWPGQACSYKIGMLKILELRAKAQKALGPKFSLKEFHNAILLAATVPLSVLEQVVDDYIAAARRS